MNLKALSGETLSVLTFRPGERAYGGYFILQNVGEKSFDLTSPDRLSKNSLNVQAEKEDLNYDTLSGPLYVVVKESNDIWRAYLYLECNILIFIPR